MLITLGHKDCWEYGYDFFKTSLLAVQNLSKQFVQCQAIAIGLALCGKKEDWDKFLKGD